MSKTPPTDPADLLILARPVQRGEHLEQCAVADCTRDHYRTHLCLAHYMRLYRWRKAHGLPRIKHDVADIVTAMQRDRDNTLSSKTRNCHVKGCDRKHQARGLCKMHHNRWLRSQGANW